MSLHDRYLRWMYRGGRPNLLARLLNRGWATLHSAGLWPDRLATLEVTGRRSHRLISFPVVIASLDGDRYLVAMLGERAEWVRNVRTEQGRATLRHGAREAVLLVNVPERERPPILRRYLECAPGARPHFPVTRDGPIEDFRRIAHLFPVFRIETRADGGEEH